MSNAAHESWLSVFGIVSIILGGLGLIMGGLFFLFGNVFFMSMMPLDETGLRMGPFLYVVSAIWLACIVLYVATGIGVLQRRSWSRTTGIITSALSLLSFPLGTAYGVLGFWLFAFNKEVIAQFKK